MKLETFFEKFDQFADAPDAVAMMRELVLNLAVQGRLVQQDSADEDVELLLARSDEARRAAAKNDRRADVETQPLLAADERWEIAESWSWRALADLVLFVDYRGRTPAKLSDGIRLLTAKNVRKGEINLAPEEFLSEEEYHAWMTRGFPKPGDVLFTTEAPMGNAAVVKLTDRFALAQRVICFQSYGAVDSSFLVLQLLSTQFQVILDKNGTGVTAKGIKASKLKQLPIAVPPLAEQKRIVAKVDELMALCDRLEAQQQERETRHAELARASLARFADAPTPANLEFLFHPSYTIPPADLRKSILTLAVQGKLVPQDPNDEPAEDVLARLEASCGNVKTRRSVPTEVIRPDTLDIENLPDSWTIESTARLLQLGAIRDLKDGNHGANHPKVAEFTETGLPFITAAQVSDDGRIDYDGAYKISGEPIKRLRVGFAKPNDVIYTHKGSVGRVAICDRECVLTPQTTYYRVNEEVLCSGFVRTNLLSPLFQDQVNLVKRQTTRDFVSINAQYQFFLRIPPLAEQRRIVAKVEQLMAIVDALESQLAASRVTAVNLLSALAAELT